MKESQEKSDLLQLLENCAERMKIQDEQERAKDPVAYAKKWKKYFEEEAILMEKRSREHKELHDSIQMSDEKARRRFTI